MNDESILEVLLNVWKEKSAKRVREQKRQKSKKENLKNFIRVRGLNVSYISAVKCLS